VVTLGGIEVAKKILLSAALLLMVVWSISAFDRNGRAQHVVLPANDLGMHCMDLDYSIFALLPPFNTVNAQVVYRNPTGYPYLLSDIDVKVDYSPTMDPSGSTNSWSLGKTNFWSYAN
jgi:hypothetical protein